MAHIHLPVVGIALLGPMLLRLFTGLLQIRTLVSLLWLILQASLSML